MTHSKKSLNRPSNRNKTLTDRNGVLRKSNKILPREFLEDLLAALCELQDNEAHRHKQFPKTRLHRLQGVAEAVYRADVNKESGWRLHVMYGSDDAIELCDILEGSAHDRADEEVKRKRGRYALSG